MAEQDKVGAGIDWGLDPGQHEGPFFVRYVDAEHHGATEQDDTPTEEQETLDGALDAALRIRREGNARPVEIMDATGATVVEFGMLDRLLTDALRDHPAPGLGG